jgi:hypothetical protein
MPYLCNDVVVSSTTVVHKVAKAKILRPERLHYDSGVYNKMAKHVWRHHTNITAREVITGQRQPTTRMKGRLRITIY